jgi:hypothetical protein
MVSADRPRGLKTSLRLKILKLKLNLKLYLYTSISYNIDNYEDLKASSQIIDYER